MISDADEREKALDPTQSFIVQAPAGSGKTELLTQRFLKLLSLANKAPEEILAVTFTRKAAGEMRQRILSAVKNASINTTPPLLPHERTTWELASAVLARDKANDWHLLQNPNRLRIFTIDALCGFLVNKSPILSQMGMMPEISDDPKKDYLEAIESLLKESSLDDQWGKSLSKLLGHLDNNIDNLVNLLLSLLASRDQWLPYLGQIQENKPILADYLNSAIERVVIDALEKVNDLLNENQVQQSALLSHLTYAAGECQKQGNQSPIIHCRELIELPEVLVEALPQWQGICALLLTQQNTWRKSFDVRIGFPSVSDTKDKAIKEERKSQKEGIMALMQVFSEQQELQDALSQIKRLPNHPLNSQQLMILMAVVEILPVLVAHLHLVFQQKQRVDFVEVSFRALQALGEDLSPTELALKLDYQLNHLLIDEYQDTSVTQYRLFEKLIRGWQPEEGRTLFLVGDPMQSIYRFRGAEVSLFLHTQRHGLANITLAPLTLSVNFRSISPLVQWINDTFVNIFPQHSEPTLGGVTYSLATSPHAPLDEKVVHLHPSLLGEDPSSEIVHIIREYQEKTPVATVAVLVRSKKHLFRLIEQLKYIKMPFIAREVDLLAQRAHVRDLMALLRATQDFTDSISWFAVLRAPWLGLKLADMLILAQQNENGILWESLAKEEIIATLSKEAQARLARFVPLMQHWFFHQERQKLSQWLRGLWIALGGPASYGKDLGAADIDTVLDLIECAVAVPGPLNMDALEEKLSQQYTDIVIDHPEKSDFHLELMTIHKAKGLEFDYVIMPSLEKRTRNTEQALLLWLERTHDEGVDLILAPKRSQKEEFDSLYQYVAEQIRQKDNYELARLLYVGATRAKKALHWVMTVEQDEAGELKQPAQGSFLGLLWPHIKDSLKLNAKKEQAQSVEEKGSNLSRLKADWQPPVSLQRVLSANLNEIQEEDQNLPPMEDNLKRVAGIVFHRFMQHEINEPTKNACRLSLRRMGLFGQRLEEAHRQVIQGLENSVVDPIGVWLRSPSHQDKQREWAIAFKLPQGVAHYVIDYSFIDENNIRWVVDYKLTLGADVTPSQLEEEIEKYSPQLTKYYQALTALESREVKCGLYFPLAKIFKEITIGN